MIRFRRRPIPGKGTPHKDVKAGYLQEARRAHDHLRRSLRAKNAAKAPLPALRVPAPAQEIPAVLYLEAFFALLLCFVHTSFASLFLTTLLNPLFFQLPLPALVILLGYRLSRRASETNVGFYRKRYFSDILGPIVEHYLIPLFLVFAAYQIILFATGMFSGTTLSLFFEFLYGRWADSSYFGLLAVELTLLFPILLQMRKNNTRRIPFWLLHIFLFSLLYDVFMTSFSSLESVSFEGDISQLYRSLPFRFLFAFALGMHIYARRNRTKKPLYYAISFLLGISYLITVYILLLCNHGEMPSYIPLFHGSPFTSAVAALYIFPILAGILYFAQRKALPKALHLPIALLGRASYYIMCIGFLYFALQKSFSFSLFPILWLDALLSLFLCAAGGILFYLLSLLPLSKQIKRVLRAVFHALRVWSGRLWRGVIILWCDLRIFLIDLHLHRLSNH